MTDDKYLKHQKLRIEDLAVPGVLMHGLGKTVTNDVRISGTSNLTTEEWEAMQAAKDPLLGYPQRYPALPILPEVAVTHEVYFVSAPDFETTRTLALWIVQGKVPNLYLTPDAAVAAWEGHPEPLKGRYAPWAVSVRVSPSTGFPDVFGRRNLLAGEPK